MATSADRGKEVRQALRDAAAALIPEVGWNAVTSRALAARAGVAQGVVHYHFDSVTAVLREAAVERMSAMMEAAVTLFAFSVPLGDAMSMLAATMDAYAEDDATNLLFSETYLAATRDELLRERVAAVVENFRNTLARYLAHHDVTDPAETAMVLTAAVDGIFLHRALDARLKSVSVGPVLHRLVTPAPGTAT